LARPVKLYVPELFAVVVALPAPPSITVVPDPLAAGLIVPEMVNVFCDPVEVEAVKFTPVT
jgi:hypothetical protein